MHTMALTVMLLLFSTCIPSLPPSHHHDHTFTHTHTCTHTHTHTQSTLDDMDMEADMKTLVSDEIKKFRQSYQVRLVNVYTSHKHNL